jgi:uncharacterized protein (TIGR02001 family)
VRLARFALFWLLALSASDLLAQLGGSVTLVSDYRYRGVTWSDDRPALQGSIAYDDPSGFYAGAFASSVQFPTRSGDLQISGYGGFAQRFDSRLSWEAGGQYTSFARDNYYNYGEVFAGLAFDNLHGRIYYAPRYMGFNTESVYGELNLQQPLFERVYMIAHAGLVSAANPYAYGPYDRRRWDVRLGAGTDWQGFALQLTWVNRASSRGEYEPSANEDRTAFVLSVSRSF